MLRVRVVCVLCVAGSISAARGVIVSVLSGQITSEPPAFFNIAAAATASGKQPLRLLLLLRIMNSNERESEKVRAHEESESQRTNAL
jgi:hypothetical protein